MSFQSSKRARSRRHTIIFAMASVAIIAAYFLLRGRGDEPDPPRVLGTGTGDTTGFYEEAGVFEEDTASDVVNIPDDVVADSVAAPPTQATTSQKSRSALALNNKAWSLHQAGKYEEAEGHLREVIRIAPGRAIAYANLGETLWKLGRNGEAAAMYRRFLELNTDPRRERIAKDKIAQITGR